VTAPYAFVLWTLVFSFAVNALVAWPRDWTFLQLVGVAALIASVVDIGVALLLPS